MGDTDVTAGEAPGQAYRGRLQLRDPHGEGEPSSGRMQCFFFSFSFNLGYSNGSDRENEREGDAERGHQERASASSTSNACQHPTSPVPFAQ